jgi:hypothetical protein
VLASRAEGDEIELWKRVETKSPAKRRLHGSFSTGHSDLCAADHCLAHNFGHDRVHGVAVIAIVHFIRHERRFGRAGIRFWRDVIIVSGAALLALLAHLVEIVIWALVFAL